jgi:eukaryotic-like serine/threonine-protein kinase
MGEVYKARDTRLDRIVAIKILRAHLDTDVDLKARFKREARAISQLNHPHICTLHDIGSHDGTDFLVMEFLEGKSLAERLRGGALPLEQVLKIGVEIAAALDKAHRAGIVHRDLKPGNIMLTKSGSKLLDFGLAKVMESAKKNEADATAALTRDLTNPGTILGTFQYMSPEQLEGKEPDPRSDIFAFGAVLYETLTGRKAFDGASQASLIASILRADPPPVSSVRSAPEDVSPAALDRIVRTCLAKDPDERWQSAGDLARELKWLAESKPQTESDVARAPGKSSRIPWILAAVAAGALFLMVIRQFSQPAVERQSIRFTVPTGARLASDVRISPDGSKLAFVGQNSEGQIVVWIRQFDKLEARSLPGTVGAAFPFWSPDNRYLAYLDRARGKLMRIDPAGGLPQIVCDASLGNGGDWNAEGAMIFSPDSTSGIQRVSAGGGVPVKVTNPGPSSPYHLYPIFLPDGRHFLYLNSPVARGGSMGVGGPSIMLASLDAKEARPLLTTRYPAAVSPAYGGSPPYLLFVRDGSLLAQEIDLKSFQLHGEPLRVADSIATDVNHSFSDFSVSRNGTLALNAGLPQHELIWIDRAGNRIGAGTAADRYSHPTLSPNGKQAVFERMDSKTGQSALWKLDVEKGEVSLFANDALMPVFLRDGSGVIFRCIVGGKISFCRKPAGGAGRQETLAQPESARAPVDVSPDGRYLAYLADGTRPGVLNTLWILALTGDGKAREFYAGDAEEEQGKFSPDGKWIAYTSFETGDAEAYVQPFPATGEKWKISTRGGGQPRWRADGKELFYRTEDGKMMAVPVRTAGGFESGAPHVLFRSSADPLFPNLGVPYDVTADGQKFLVNEAVDGNRLSSITVITNWTASVGK